MSIRTRHRTTPLIGDGWVKFLRILLSFTLVAGNAAASVATVAVGEGCAVTEAEVAVAESELGGT